MECQDGNCGIEDFEDFFCEEDWICTGKKYGEDVPLFVVAEQNKRLQIPNPFLQELQLPGDDITVEQFIRQRLPHISLEFIVTNVGLWFSSDIPDATLPALLARSIPSETFLKSMEHAFSQAWFNGARSISDPRFNEGSDRLPLWVLTYWRKAITLKNMQNRWIKSNQWLNHEEARSKDPEVKKMVLKVRQMFAQLEWNGRMKYYNNMTYTLELSRFLGTMWLSDDHIYMMMEEFTLELAKLSGNIQIAHLSFASQISKVDATIQASAQVHYARSFLGRLEDTIKSNSVEKLFFPVHINGNHWIAGMIDFKEKQLHFGAWF